MNSDNNTLVKLNNAGFRQNDKWLVEGVSLKVEKGKIVTLIGPNGSGKSTLANVLSGKKGYEIKGFGLNGTGLSITDSIILSQLDGKLKTDDILKKFEIPDAFKQLMPFFYGPFDIVPDLSKVEDIDILIDLSNDLCIEWKSQLQLEWSPFLWDFFNNLRFLKKIIEGNDKKSLEAWALRRYSGPLNEIISRKLKKKGS